MGRKRTPSPSSANGAVDKPKRTRIMPEFTLVANNLKTGEREELITVMGTTAAKAVFTLANRHLSDKYDGFKHVKQSTVTFAE